MRLAPLFCFAALLCLPSCSDDGVPQTSANAEGTTTGEPNNGTLATSDRDDTGEDPGASEGTSNGPATTGSASTGPSDGTSGDPTGEETSGSEGSGSSDTGESDTSGTDTGEGSSSSGDVCEPAADGAAIHQDCGPMGAMCPPGYTCQPFSGIVDQLSCQILCEDDCECPEGTTCNEVTDMTMTIWHQCG